MQVVAERSLNEWIDYVITEYHEPLRGELARLAELASQVHVETPARDLALALGMCHELGQELLLHVRKEENVLFPWIRAGRGSTAGAPIQVMTLEHHEALELMARINPAATVAVASASPSQRAWGEAYLAFEERMREHMRIEDEELFPRALSGR